MSELLTMITLSLQFVYKTAFSLLFFFLCSYREIEVPRLVIWWQLWSLFSFSFCCVNFKKPKVDIELKILSEKEDWLLDCFCFLLFCFIREELVYPWVLFVACLFVPVFICLLVYLLVCLFVSASLCYTLHCFKRYLITERKAKRDRREK